MMPPRFAKQYVKIALMALAFACLMLTLRHSIKDLKDLPQPKTGWLLLTVVLFQFHYFIQALGWHGMLSSLGRKCPMTVSMRMYYMSLIARWMPGRIWYTATRIYLGREVGIPAVVTTFAMLLELTYVLVGGLIVTLLFAGTLLPGLFGTVAGQVALGTVGLGILIVATLATRPDTPLSLVKSGFFRKAFKRISGEEISTTSLPAMPISKGIMLLAWYTFLWVFSGVMFGVLGETFIPMNHARWQACTPAFAGSWLVGFFSLIAPAGLGTREGVMLLMLRPVMPTSYAAILTVSSRVAMFASELLGIALVSAALRVGAALSKRGVPAPPPADVDPLSPVHPDLAVR